MIAFYLVRDIFMVINLVLILFFITSLSSSVVHPHSKKKQPKK